MRADSAETRRWETRVPPVLLRFDLSTSTGGNKDTPEACEPEASEFIMQEFLEQLESSQKYENVYQLFLLSIFCITKPKRISIMRSCLKEHYDHDDR
mmetsp:Transcript_38055/g.50122  ORF Transcript_38055/g.50122 Transcript_38055/m.50122 type:complete len:97 (-) Transcript_38055:187-477(-)